MLPPLLGVVPDGRGKDIGRRDGLHHGPTPRALSHVPQASSPLNSPSSLLHAAIACASGAWQPNNASPNVAARRRATEGGVVALTTRRQSSLVPHKPPAPRSTPRRPTEMPSVGEAEALSPGQPTAIEQLSRIPREFFILETNAVLPHAQYPPSQYQSTFLPGAGLWETIVFPALAPQTRQQVLYLAQVVERLRVQTLGHMTVGNVADNKSSRAVFLQDAALVTQYAEKEWALYSMCYHELVRQIKFICREQGELLRETHERYDAIVRRLLDLVAAAVERIRESPIDRRSESRSPTDSDCPEIHADASQSPTSESQALRERSAERISRSRQSRSRRQRGSATNADDERTDGGCEWTSDGDDDDELLLDDDENDDDDASDDDTHDDEKEEQRVKREQQRRRRLMARWGQHERQSRISTERASVIEENFAAARVQQAFHRYLLRKEQLRLAQRQEKANAVLEIQRSYRGYKARQRMLHRRAVQQVIAKRRKEAAAVELLQANVRTFLLKKRREQKYLARHQAALERLREERARLTERLMESQAATSQRPNASNEGGDQSPAAAADQQQSPHDAAGLSGRESAEPAETSGEAQNQQADDLYARLLAAMTELSSTVSTLRVHPNKRRESTRHHRLSATPAPNGHPAVGETQAAEPVASLQTPETDASTEQQDAEKDDEQRIVGEAIGRAEALARSFTTLLATLKQSLVAASDSRASSAECGEGPVMSKTTSTSSLLLLEHPLARARTMTPMSTRPGTRDGTVQPSDWLKEAMASSFIFMDDSALPETSRQPTKPRGLVAGRTQSANQGVDDADDNDRVVVDDVLWHSLEYTPRPLGETRLISRQLRLLLSSREDRRRLVTLKQFISDVYDTLVGRLRELPRSRWSRLVLTHCSLAMSFADAERFLRRQNVSKRAKGASYSAHEPVSSYVALDLPRLLREHFQCQVGLKHLVDDAMASFMTSLYRLADVDPDVKRFLGFLTAETPQEELVFFCVCRVLAADGTSRQPVFEDTTMREIIDSEHAMAIATSLFRAADEADLIAQDALVVEPTNEIYQRHLPSTCLSQLQVVLRQLVPGPDDSGATDEDDASGDAVPHEALGLDPLSPQLLSLLASASSRVRLRATNANQFHASVFNASAPRSPLMRQSPGIGAGHDATVPRWLYFDDVVDLLRRYRVAMRHFHAFVRWARELFEIAVGEQAAEEARLFASARQTQRRPHDVPLLEESAFVRTLAPYSLAASERELHNVFHNALKQRHLQRVMPLRVFVSVVIVLLRNGFLSVSSYQPLQRRHNRDRKDGEQARDGAAAQTYRLDQEEAQWRQLALRWRGQEQRFEAAIEAIYAERDGEDATARDSKAMELLQARNELYELLMSQSGRASLQRAREVLSLLVTSLDRIHRPQDGATDDDNDGTTQRERAETRERSQSHEHVSVVDAVPQDDDVVSPAEAVGSPWDQEIIT